MVPLISDRLSISNFPLGYQGLFRPVPSVPPISHGIFNWHIKVSCSVCITWEVSCISHQSLKRYLQACCTYIVASTLSQGHIVGTSRIPQIVSKRPSTLRHLATLVAPILAHPLHKCFRKLTQSIVSLALGWWRA